MSEPFVSGGSIDFVAGAAISSDEVEGGEMEWHVVVENRLTQAHRHVAHTVCAAAVHTHMHGVLFAGFIGSSQSLLFFHPFPNGFSRWSELSPRRQGGTQESHTLRARVPLRTRDKHAQYPKSPALALISRGHNSTTVRVQHRERWAGDFPNLFARAWNVTPRVSCRQRCTVGRSIRTAT